MISVTDVTMRYPVPKRYVDLLMHPFKNKWNTALRDLTLSIATGDCIALLGPNGAGKTTLLRLIGGLIYPTSGSVEINGFDTETHNLEVRRSVGFVMNEERSFYWRLTGVQNLEFFGALDNIGRQELRGRISKLLQLVGLGNDGDKRVAHYSTGMRQRLGIARGLLCEPEILLLDEPTRSLDPVGADDLHELISNHLHARRNKTLIIATHDIQEAELLCNRVCCIFRGKVRGIRDLTEIRKQAGGLAAFYRSELKLVESTNACV